jgi:hypothetical protein
MAHRHFGRRRAAEPESAEEQHRAGTIPGVRVGGKCFFRLAARNANAMDTTQSHERAARNEVLFREANEKLGDKRQELEIAGRTPFLCECDDPTCTELVRLSLEQYEHARSQANWFLVAIGHDPQEALVDEDHDGYAIVEKIGVAGRIAEEHNPRR